MKFPPPPKWLCRFADWCHRKTCKERLLRIQRQIQRRGGSVYRYDTDPEDVFWKGRCPESEIWICYVFPEEMPDELVQAYMYEMLDAASEYHKALGGSGLKVLSSKWE